MACRAQFQVLRFVVLGLLFSFNATFASPCLQKGEEILQEEEELTEFFEAFNPISVEELDQALSVARIELQKVLEDVGSSGSNFEDSLNLAFPRMESIAVDYFQKLGSNSVTRTRLNEMALQELNQFLSRSDLNPHQLLTALMFNFFIQEDEEQESESPENSLPPEIYQRLVQMALSSTDSGFKNYALQLLAYEKKEELLDPIIHQVLNNDKPSNSLLISVFNALETKSSAISIEVGASVALHLKRILKKLSEKQTPSQLNLGSGTEDSDNEDILVEGEVRDSENSEALVDGLRLFTKVASHSFGQNSEDSSFYLLTLSEIISSILKSDNVSKDLSEDVFRTIVKSASPELFKQIINNHQAHLSSDHKNLHAFVYELLQPYLSSFRDQSGSSGLHLIEAQISKELEKSDYWKIFHLISYLPTSKDWQQLRLQTLNRILSKLDDDEKVEFQNLLIGNLTALMPENGLQILDDYWVVFGRDVEAAREVFSLKDSQLETPDLRRLLELSRYVRLDYFVPKLFQIMEKPSESLERRKLAWRALAAQYYFPEDIKQRLKSVIEREVASFDNESDWRSPRGRWITEIIESLPIGLWQFNQNFDDE